jgi:hypothetical protein
MSLDLSNKGPEFGFVAVILKNTGSDLVKGFFVGGTKNYIQPVSMFLDSYIESIYSHS